MWVIQPMLPKRYPVGGFSGQFHKGGLLGVR